MDHESPEVIGQEMEQTRASLTEKVSALEQQVVGTIQDVTSTVQTVRSAVQETLHSVKDTVNESVHTVADTMKTTFDLPRHTRNHPWEMVAGATALGFVTGLLAFGRREHSIMARGSWEGSAAVRTEPTANGQTAGSYRGEGPTARRPSWVDELLDRVGREALKIGEVALATATASIRQTVEAELPKLIGEGVPRLIGTSHPPPSASHAGYGPDRTMAG
jgi:ElaB/YqjD/DUF883 family membrane-anchored ribosome-binding protein